MRLSEHLFILMYIRHGDGVKDVAFTVEDLDGIMEKCKVVDHFVLSPGPGIRNPDGGYP